MSDFDPRRELSTSPPELLSSEFPSSELLSSEQLSVERLRNSRATFRLFARITFVLLLFLQIFYGLLGVFRPSLPWLPLSLVNAGLVLCNLVALVLLWRKAVDFQAARTQKRFRLALTLYVVGMILAVGAHAYFLEGVSSPILWGLVVVVLFAGLVGGRQAAVRTTVGVLFMVIMLYLLEQTGMMSPVRLTVPQRDFFNPLFLLTASGVILRVLISFLNRNRAASDALQHYARSLEAQTQRAQVSATEMDAARQRERQLIQRLGEVLRLYADFLGRILEGDYEARLDLQEVAQEKELGPDLLRLGQFLNTTISSLLTSLQEAREAQQVYMQRSWESFMEAGEVPTGYRYRASAIAREEIEGDLPQDTVGEGVEIIDDVWLPAMQAALRSQRVAVDAGEVALPMALREEVMGALDIRRIDGLEWSEEELLMVRDIVDQLTQTIDRLRLVEESNRNAALEQRAGEITASIRAEFEIEAVLEQALRQLGKALGAELGSAHLALGQQSEGEGGVGDLSPNEMVGGLSPNEVVGDLSPNEMGGEDVEGDRA